MSPTKLNRSLSTNNQANTPTTVAPKPVNGFLTPTTPVSQMRTPSEKPGGPPIKGLYESTPGKKKFGTPLSGTPRMLGGTPINSTPQLSFGATPSRDHDVTDSSVLSDGNTWVTIFGFPPHAASYILSQFSQCGTILQHHIPPNGNWMNVRFQTKLQAQKALARSGRVFGGSLMVGVSICTEPPADAVNASHILEQTNNQDNSILSLNSSLATHNRSIRPLTQSYKAAHNEHEVRQSRNSTFFSRKFSSKYHPKFDEKFCGIFQSFSDYFVGINKSIFQVSAIANTPNKNNGIVSKAMEYIFGW